METIKIHRGDKTPVEIYLPGDYSNITIAFGATANKELTADRLIYIEDDEITKSYNSEADETKVSFVLLPEQTDYLEYPKLYAEIVDLDNNTTPYKGIILIERDVITPYNNLPSEVQNLRYILVDTKDFENYTMLLFTKEQGLIPISISDLSGLVCSEDHFAKDEIDLFNLEGVTSTYGWKEDIDKIANNSDLVNLLELDAEGNLTIKDN